MGIGRGRRIELKDRQECLQLIQEAEQAGASVSASCELMGIDVRTVQRWKKSPEQEDQRRGPKTASLKNLTLEEKNEMLEIANSVEYRDLNPHKIVAKLADSGRYLASESSFYRLLKNEQMLSHRSKSKPRLNHPPRCLLAKAPNEIWSWDITYLKTRVKGLFYYLYLIEDIYSRMIVGWSVEEMESADLAARLIEESCKKNNIEKDQITLHSDNGSPMKGATMLCTLQRLGVAPSFSRPSVSDDNPYSEALFKTLKYCPQFPEKPFESIEKAKAWVEQFVKWYNEEHLHSEIKFVTPLSRHEKKDEEILKKRDDVYKQAKNKNPIRWSKNTRNWSPIKEVYLNRGNESKANVNLLRNKAS